ncbi:polysaccharide deacetylase family protein, partial [Nocardioides sp.]|uniref:polysaccharide deacetylase family protein n=1 Tax=Nocardioides sp. TaxID=35761 RepID=UPI00356943A9
MALTFDDGPSPKVTPGLIRTLRAKKVPATFFMVGSRVKAAPGVARAVERAGFLVANHSYAHQSMTTQSTAQIVGTIRATDAALRGAGTHPLSLVRPPYGAVDGAVRAAARRTSHPIVLWDVDPRDWDGRSSDQIASSVLAQLRPGRRNIVLLHDGVANSPRTVAAVPRIINAARGRGFCFVGLNGKGKPGFPTPTARLVVGKQGLKVPEGRDLKATVRLSAPAGRATTVQISLARGTASLRRDVGRFARTVRVPA